MARSLLTSAVAAAQRTPGNPVGVRESYVWQAMRAATQILAASKNEAEK